MINSISARAGSKSAETLLLVDFDNTLFFTDEIAVKAAAELTGKRMRIADIRALRKLEKNKIYRHAFSNYYMESVPNRAMLEALKVKHGPIVILTAKTKGDRMRIAELLSQNGIKSDRIILRPEKYLMAHDEEWKLMEMRKLAKRYKNIEFYEDKIDNIEYIKANLKSARLKCFLVSGGSIKEQ
ncbi:MAG: hypothetical protein M1544_00960 [Candidatus Marsarchaeota archaeon]|nr:hypothetical protein [Candidatus Marsarchaeota archaeon]